MLLRIKETDDAKRSQRHDRSLSESPTETWETLNHDDHFTVQKPATFVVLIVWYWCFVPFVGWGVARFLPP